MARLVAHVLRQALVHALRVTVEYPLQGMQTTGMTSHLRLSVSHQLPGSATVAPLHLIDHLLRRLLLVVLPDLLRQENRQDAGIDGGAQP